MTIIVNKMLNLFFFLSYETRVGINVKIMKTLVSLSFLTLIAGITFSGCVSQNKYQMAVAENEKLKGQSRLVDSLQQVNTQLRQDVQDMTGYYKKSLQEMEQMAGTNRGIYNSYQELKEKYDRIVSQREAFNNTASYEKQNLTAQLSAYQQELDKKEQYLRNLEWELAQREERLNLMQQEDVRSDLATAQQTIQQLQYQLQQKNAVTQQLKTNIAQSMYGLAQSDFSVTEKRGKLYLSMSQNLLFPSGSTQLDPRGQQALRQLAQALRNNPDIDIVVEGHTDTDGTAQQNWQLSVNRAIAVINELAASGVDPARLTAAGRAFYQPIAPNTTDAGKALNRRTEIIISPKLDELMDLVNGQQN